MKPRLFIAVSLAALWLFVLFGFLRYVAPVTGSPAASATTLQGAETLASTSALTRDVVINEVAWAGTSSSTTADEWIELYNNTDSPLDLGGWTLRIHTQTLISLSGIVPARAYYLLERTDDNTISDITADWKGGFGTGGLSNSGEVLTLTDPLSNVIDTANINGGTWPTGTASPDYRSMERINPLLPDTDDNWAANNPAIKRNGLDANSNSITGTPKQPNSATPAELSIVKSAPGTVLTNQPITYVLMFGNAGGKNATGVVITDLLPVSVTLITQTSFYAFTQTGRMLGWQIGSLSSYSGTISFTVVVSPETDLTGWLTNTAIITSEVADYRPDNNAYTITTWIRPPLADVGIAKSGPDSVNAGSELTYTIMFSNTGEIDAANVIITDTLPLSVTFVRGTEAYSFSQPVSGTLVWMTDSVPFGGQPFSLTVVVDAAPDAAGWLTNQVTITTTTNEVLTDNNSDEAATLVVSPPPVVIPPHVLISAVHQHGYDGVNDEAAQLTNVGTQTVSLLNWQLTEGSASVTLPAFNLGPGERVWVANRADSFYNSFGAWPDFAKVTTSSVLPLTGTSWLGLADEHGDLRLKDPLGVSQDRMLYGTATTPPGDGWESTAVQPYTPTTAFAQAGQILYRKLDEATGLPHDTDTSADWAQDQADPIAGRRVRYPGWNLEQFYRTVQITQTAWLTVGIAPDNAFDVISQVIASAQQTLTIEVYSFENAALAELLAARARAGVSVTLLLEGEPAGGLTDQEKWSCQQVQDAGGACWFMFNDTTLTPKVYDRYSNQHAKMIVADDRLASIGPENLSPRSLPDDVKSDGTAGQRGVVLVTDAPGVVQAARQIWAADFDPGRFRDLTRWSSSSSTYGPPPIGFVPITVTGGTTYTVLFPQPVVLSGTFPFEVIQSPENSLRQSDSLLGLIGRAGSGDEIAVEQLQEPPHWGPTAGTPTSDPNVFLEALIAAASRGARVRILMDSYFDDGNNAATVAYVESLRAQSPTLRANLQAHLGNPTALGIHNKMLLASIAGRGYAHIGSLNHGELAAKGNREVAVQVESQNLYSDLVRLFQADWQLAAPTFLPLVMRDYKPPDHIVISEVYYSNTVTLQWVELYNPMSNTVSLADWKIGDADTPQRYEGMYRFPSGTVIGPGGVLVIAYDGTQVPQANFQMCQNCGGIAPVLAKYVGWGSGDWTLRGAGDQVLLLGPNDIPVDVVVYGDATYPGVIAHPGVSVYTHSLERFPANQDTDNCAADFRDRYPPTPGKVP